MEIEEVIYIAMGCIGVFLIVALIASIPKPYDETILENNTVVRVIDGDTFEYYDLTTDKVIKVRLLCVDTPEKREDGYEEARDHLRSLIMYREVRLVSSITDKDKYGRLLRYVYVNELGENVFVNKRMITEGYGELMIVAPEECAIVK
jgi:micrococcal nuclease